MLFLIKITYKKKFEKAPSLCTFFGRAFFSFPLFLKAGMALEGCLVLPLFLFFMATLLYSLEMVRFQSDVYEAMHQTGSKMCFQAYEMAYEQGDANPFSGGEKDEIKQYLGMQCLPYLCVVGGSEGVLIETAWNSCGEGNVEIKVTYGMKPFIGSLPIGDITIVDGFLGHGFVGYVEAGNTDEKKEQEIYVYITPSGTKYHFTEECTYLKIKLKAVSADKMKQLRNESGEKYYPCEYCHPKDDGLVYLTEWGNRYHGESDCPSIKRTVYIVPLSKVGDRSACSKCG